MFSHDVEEERISACYRGERCWKRDEAGEEGEDDSAVSGEEIEDNDAVSWDESEDIGVGGGRKRGGSRGKREVFQDQDACFHQVLGEERINDWYKIIRFWDGVNGWGVVDVFEEGSS